MTDARDLALALIELENLSVQLTDDGTVKAARALTTDDAVSMGDACQIVFDHGAEVRDVTVAPDHKEVVLSARLEERRA